MALRPRDFKSLASTCFATPAHPPRTKRTGHHDAFQSAAMACASRAYIPTCPPFVRNAQVARTAAHGTRPAWPDVPGLDGDPFSAGLASGGQGRNRTGVRGFAVAKGSCCGLLAALVFRVLRAGDCWRNPVFQGGVVPCVSRDGRDRDASRSGFRAADQLGGDRLDLGNGADAHGGAQFIEQGHQRRGARTPASALRPLPMFSVCIVETVPCLVVYFGAAGSLSFDDSEDLRRLTKSWLTLQRFAISRADHCDHSGSASSISTARGDAQGRGGTYGDAPGGQATIMGAGAWSPMYLLEISAIWSGSKTATSKPR